MKTENEKEMYKALRCIQTCTSMDLVQEIVTDALKIVMDNQETEQVVESISSDIAGFCSLLYQREYDRNQEQEMEHGGIA